MQVLAGAELYLNLTSLFLLILFSTKFNILLDMVNYYFYIFFGIESPNYLIPLDASNSV